MKKLNVGVALQGDPQKGITLIALIITIIVMLILVGVTINVALNGGLFDKAKTASEQTQRETDKEHLLSLITGTLTSRGDLQITTTNLTKDDWTAEQSENASYIKCTSPKNEVFYVNRETGEIFDTLPEEKQEESEYVYYTNEDIGVIAVIKNTDNTATFYNEIDGEYEIDSAGEWHFSFPNEFKVYLDGNIETEQDGGKAYYNINSGQVALYTKDSINIYIITNEENGISKFNSSIYVTLNEQFDKTLLE